MSTLKDWTAAHREWVDGFVLTLRDAGVPGSRIGDELAAVHAHCRDADTFPDQELGPGPGYARSLLADPAHALGGTDAQTRAAQTPDTQTPGVQTPGHGGGSGETPGAHAADTARADIPGADAGSGPAVHAGATTGSPAGSSTGPASDTASAAGNLQSTAVTGRRTTDPQTRAMVEGFLPVAAQVALLFVTAYAIRGWILRVDLQLNAGTLICWVLCLVLLLVMAGLSVRDLRRLVRPVPLLGLYVASVVLGIAAALFGGTDLPILVEGDPRPVAVAGVALILLIAVVATVRTLRGARKDQLDGAAFDGAAPASADSASARGTSIQAASVRSGAARPQSARLVTALMFWLIPAYLLLDAGITAMTAP